MSSSRPAPAPARPSRFRIVRDLGFGAQGTVHEAVDLERNARVALKTLRSIGGEEIVRLKTEFRAVRDLQHPNLVRLGELMEEGGRWFFTMELVEGVDFLTYLRGEPALDDSASWPTRVESGPRARALALARGNVAAEPPPSARVKPAFNEARVRPALAQLASAIAFLHRQGKVHCDVKPSNILVDRLGRVVLIDFGVVADFAAESDEEQAVVGTALYMAPEQALGAPVGPAADWYAAGVLLFEALTGRRPFEGDANDVMERKCLIDPPAPRDVAPGIPADLEALCVQMLARDPDDRPREAEILLALGVADVGADATARSLFVGREEELAALAASLAEVRDGGSRSIFLEGESGVGKSALLRRFVEETRRDDPRVVVLEGRCHEQERVPYNAFDATLDGLARFLRGRREATRMELLPPHFERLARVFPALGKLAEARSDPPGPVRATGSRAERDDAFATLRELLRRVGARRTLLVVVEDAQWADADSLALLEAITDGPGAPRMLLVATARPRSDGSPCAAISRVRGVLRRVPLAGLEDADAERLLRHLLAERSELPPDAATSILESGRGHPMFLEELVRYVGQARANPGAVTLDDAVSARADELDPTTRSVLRAIATAGQPTAQAVIAEAAGVPFAIYADSVALLRDARLARAYGTRQEDLVEPYHDRVREAVYARLEPPARRAIHAALGASLERRAASVELLQWHFAASGDRARAARYAELGAEAAARALAFDRAAALYKSALDGGPPDDERRRRLLVSMGECLLDAGRSKEAGESFLEASRTGALSESLRLELLRRAAEQFLVSGHLGPGIDALRLVLAEYGLSLPASRFVALARLAWYQLRLAHRDLSWDERKPEDVLPSAAARIDLCWSVSAGLGLVDSLRSILFVHLGALLALEHGDDGRLARALAAAAVAEAGLGRAAQASRVGEACRRAAASAGTDRDRFYGVLAGFTYRFFLENDWRGCLDGTREAQRLWRAGGRTEGWESEVVEQFACWALDNMGRFQELRARVPARIRAARQAGNRFIEVNFRTQFVNLFLLEDRPDEARADVLDAIASWPRIDDEFGNQDYLALRNLTYVAIYAGDVDALETKLRGDWKRYFASLIARVVFLRQDALYWTGAAWLLLASASDRGGTKWAASMRAAERAARDLRRFDLPMAAASALHLRAGIAACRGDLVGARRALEQALVHAEVHATDLHAACIRWRLGELLGRETSEGRDYRAKAEEWMGENAVRAPARLVAAVLPGWRRAP